MIGGCPSRPRHRKGPGRNPGRGRFDGHSNPLQAQQVVRAVGRLSQAARPGAK